MERRHFIRQSALTVGAIAFLKQNMFGMTTEDPWKITMLRDNLGIFEERGGTIAFLMSKEGFIVVDAQFPDQSQHLIGELKKRSPESPFRLLINTHHHGDHTAGNISFKGLTQHVLAHTNSKINQENSARQNKSEDKQLYPDQTFGETWCEKFGKEKICLQYYGAGHTNGDTFVHFQHSDVVHCGDLVFNRRHPFVDRTAGANMKSWIEVLDKAVDKFGRKTTYVFGHSGAGYQVTGTVEDVKAFRRYLENVLAYVDREIKAGKTKDDILKATIIPGCEEWKTDGIQRPLQAAYEELTTK